MYVQYFTKHYFYIAPTSCWVTWVINSYSRVFRLVSFLQLPINIMFTILKPRRRTIPTNHVDIGSIFTPSPFVESFTKKMLLTFWAPPPHLSARGLYTNPYVIMTGYINLIIILKFSCHTLCSEKQWTIRTITITCVISLIFFGKKNPYKI